MVEKLVLFKLDVHKLRLLHLLDLILLDVEEVELVVEFLKDSLDVGGILLCLNKSMQIHALYLLGFELFMQRCKVKDFHDLTFSIGFTKQVLNFVIYKVGIRY